MINLYYISGLGADERVFQFLRIQGVKINFIHWEIPAPHENIKDYCGRLIEQIDVSSQIILVGVSFGGLIAQEISKIIPVHQIFIISSIKSLKELDCKLKLIRFLKLYTIVPARFLKWSNRLTADYYFGTKTKEESELLKQIINDTDLYFMKWAISVIMTWNNIQNSIPAVIHIHGTSDRIFPVTNTKNVIQVKEGGHFMIVNRAKEISKIIETKINSNK